MDADSLKNIVIPTSDSTSRKRDDVQKAATAAVRMRVKKQLQKCFLTASEGRGSRWLTECSQSLQEIYYYVCIQASKFSDGIKYFIFCFRFIVERLWERSIGKLSWNNCVKLATNVSLGLSLKGDTKLIDFLVELCDQLIYCDVDVFSFDSIATSGTDSASQLPVVRLRTHSCNLAELIFILEKKVDEVAKQSNNDQRSCLSLKNKLRLYNTIVEREFDSNSTVRVAVLRAIAAMENKDILDELLKKHVKLPENSWNSCATFAHLQDVSSECRLAAVNLLSLDNESSVELMIETALADDDESVRKSCLIRLAKEVQAQNLKTKLRMTLLKGLFLHSTDASNSALLRQLLNRTMLSVNKEYEGVEQRWKSVVPELLSLLDFYNEEELSHSVIVLSLACCRENLKMDDIECHYFLKEILYTGSCWALNSHNYKQLLDRNMTSSHLAAMTFWLRCTAGYCKLHCRTDADLFECYYKLLPTMTTFINFIKKQVLFLYNYIFGKRFNENDRSNDNFALIQLLKIIPLFSQDDASGRQAWRALLQALLLNYEIHLDYKVISIIVKQLYQHFWPLQNDLEEALQFICDTTSSIVHHSYNPHATILMENETIALNVLNSTAPSDSVVINVIEEAALLRCIMIINAMARMNRHRQMSTLLLGLLDNVVEKGLISENAKCRSLAFEAMGIITMCDEQCARQKTIFIRDTLELVDTLKVAALNTLCNYSLIFGFTSVAKWYKGNDSFDDPASDLLHVFRTGIWDKDSDSDFSYAACRGLCQLVLSKNLRSDESILCDLLLKSFHSETKDQQLVKSCLDCFLNCYSSECRENQLLLVNCFKRIFDNVATNEVFKDSEFDMTEFANSILFATSTQRLKASKNKKSPAHIALCGVILEMLFMEGDYDNSLLCEMLSQFDVRSWGNNVKFIKEVRDRVEDLMADFDDNGKVVRNLRLFFRKIEDCLHVLDTPKMARNKTIVYNESNEDPDIIELVSGTSRIGLRTPLTRSASKKLSQSTALQNANETCVSDSFKEIHNIDNAWRSGISRNVSGRRTRRCLTSVFKESSCCAFSSLSPLKEIDYNETSKAEYNQDVDDLVEEMVERIARINCNVTTGKESCI
uniref:Cnd3 domain-containing protein n=1 Tax=Syphacia muris TaxID=451379 RepID=A0A0N5APX7_9BILA